MGRSCSLSKSGPYPQIRRVAIYVAGGALRADSGGRMPECRRQDARVAVTVPKVEGSWACAELVALEGHPQGLALTPARTTPPSHSREQVLISREQVLISWEQVLITKPPRAVMIAKPVTGHDHQRKSHC